MKLFVWLFLIPIPAFAAERAVDLGRLSVEGKMRGPEMQWIDGPFRDFDMLGRFLAHELDRIEKDLDLVRSESTKKESK